MTNKLAKFFLVLILFFKISMVYAEEIKNYQVDISINKNGVVDIKEAIDYDFGDLERHGIYRALSFVKKNNQRKKFKLEFINFSVIDENGQPYRFQKLKEEKNIKLKIGDPEKTITGLHRYIISYQVLGALTYFSDHDELYWNAIGTDWPVAIKEAKVNVKLPSEISEKDIKIACYQGQFGMRELCQGQIIGNQIVFSAASLGKNQGLTVVVGFPKNIVSVLEPKPYTSFWGSFWGVLLSLLIVLLVLFWYFFLPTYIIYRWFKYGRDPKVDVGITTAWYDPPKTPDGQRFLSPAEVGVLGDEKVDLKDISATIVDLARRGYLIIEERKKGDFYLLKQNIKEKEKLKELLPFEELLLNEFFSKKDELRLRDSHLSYEVGKIKTAIYDEVLKQKLFSENPDHLRVKYMGLGTVGLFTGNIFLFLVSLIFGLRMPRKTVEGVKAKNVAFSLRNFLKSQERQLKFQADKKMLFERLLPYAIIFGVELIWAKRFINLDMEPPDWYQGYQTTHFNSTIFVNNLNSSLSSFQSAATPTQSSSGFSSGFSGGSSGGGGGGGGGGSW